MLHIVSRGEIRFIINFKALTHHYVLYTWVMLGLLLFLTDPSFVVPTLICMQTLFASLVNFQLFSGISSWFGCQNVSG